LPVSFLKSCFLLIKSFTLLRRFFRVISF